MCWFIGSYISNCLIYRILKKGHIAPSVVDRGIEPLCQDWESCILTIRWIDQHFKNASLRDPLGAEGGGFEPPVREPVRQFSKLLVSATHPSFQRTIEFETLGYLLDCGCKGTTYFWILQIFMLLFFEKVIWRLLPPWVQSLDRRCFEACRPCVSISFSGSKHLPLACRYT